jgi:hypothetical protein
MSTATVQARDTQLHWCRWFHCESSFNLMLVPNEPGIFAVAEEVVTERPGQVPQRELSIFQMTAVDDLFHALNRLYQHDCPLREKLEKSRCFLRYAAVADAPMRARALADLQRWLDLPGDTGSPFVRGFVNLAENEESPFRARGD